MDAGPGIQYYDMCIYAGNQADVEDERKLTGYERFEKIASKIKTTPQKVLLPVKVDAEKLRGIPIFSGLLLFFLTLILLVPLIILALGLGYNILNFVFTTRA